MLDRRNAYLLLNILKDIGPQRIHLLRKHFKRIEEVFTSSRQKLLQIEGIGEKIAERIISAPQRIDLRKEWSLIKKYQVKIVTIEDREYPPSLALLSTPPPLLYWRGSLKNFSPAIAVVGTRLASSYGKAVTEELVKSLVQRGVTIVSGLARGIDTSAHRAALKEGGKTIAVLGNGLARHYPPENKNLGEEIVQKGGALLSEFSMESSPERGNFPQRNRIIAGLSLGVIVVEAGLKSGALITARFALEQGKDVFAVPGSIFSSRSRGTHYLIKQGAKLIEKIEDLLEEIRIIPAAKEKLSSEKLFSELSEEEKIILEYLKEEPASIDYLIGKTGFSLGEISQSLLSLEIKGMIKSLAGKIYQYCGDQ